MTEKPRKPLSLSARKVMKHYLYTNEYKDWRNECKRDNRRFFATFSSFERFLSGEEISKGAVALYLLIGLRSSQEGTSYLTDEAMAEALGRDSRTIRRWLRELKAVDLISRVQLEADKVPVTYLRPYYELEEEVDAAKEGNEDDEE